MVATIAGGLSAWMAFSNLQRRPDWLAHDFTYPWRAGRALLEGVNPYHAADRLTGEFPHAGNFFYPLTTAVVATPFARFTPILAGTIFFGVSGALLAFALTRTAYWRLFAMGSAPFFMASFTIQWSPIVMAGALLPAVGFAIATKPNLGLMALAYRPRLSVIVGAVILGVVSLVLVPTWPVDWLEVIRRPPAHLPVLSWPFGFVGLFAVLRWRTPEARVLIAATLLPAVPWFYDQLLLWLIPRTFKQTLFLTMSSWITWLLVFTTQSLDFSGGMRHIEPFITLGLFLPALAIVLRLPNPDTEARLAGR